MGHDEITSNKSANRLFDDVLQVNLARRKVLTGGLVLAAGSFFFGMPGMASATVGEIKGANVATGKRRKNGLVNFNPVKLADGGGPWPMVSSDYKFDVLIPWGEPLQPGGPLFSHPPTAHAQASQIGIGHDGMWFFPIKGSSEHGMLAINHEFGRNQHVLGKPNPVSLNDVRVSQHAHGVSVVEIKKVKGEWLVVSSRAARRIHVNTPVAFSGPVAGHFLLQTRADNEPMGTVNNCSCGYTPWGTYLTCEENFNGYFGAKGDWNPSESQARYGFSGNGFGYGWHAYDPRFDLANKDFHNEENRFGWVVEIDPMDATQKPVKRTALGRFKHEGIALTVGRDSRVVGYMGDDQRFDYIYKFVSDDNHESMRARGLSPLDYGVLYVARFNDDGSGEWLPLTIDNPALAARFASQAALLIDTRMAADIVAATPMDRPEWITVAPNGEVYCTLTNNSRRTTADAANPMAPNNDGHIIKWRDSEQHTGTTFEWDIFMIANKTHGTEQSFSAPDGIWADPDGRLFIQTDGGQQDGLNNQMLVADTLNGEIRRLFTGVAGAEISGITVTPDRSTMFINIQHPGNGDATRSNFPEAFDGVTVPRDATIVLTRVDGGIIGS
ncbi:Putative phosphatase [hydrothermal vent metagenome]|uniref:Phosphatase n=1 Tax=hydrothermal vent metagenome TaxID=652676 RepID=A0A3B0ZJI1_9ZZZZ